MANYYMLDGIRIPWLKLIKEALALDEGLDALDLLTTSQAAEILRSHGHIVEE